MLNARKVNTSKVMCFAGSKIFHINTQGNITRCWSFQSKEELQCLGNVSNKESIKLLQSPVPCYSPICFCQHPTARNAYYYSCLTPFFRVDYKELGENIFSIKNEYSNNKKYKVITLAGIKMKFRQRVETGMVVRESNPSI